MTKGKILFVEDDLETANMLRLYFESQGYEIMHATWGRDGIEMSYRNPPDLAVLDVRLPDIDGYEVCREMRRNWRTSQIPIIFLTERKERDDRIAGLKLGAVDYLAKPFDLQELRLRVRNALNRSRFESLVDPITALPGSKLLDARLKELLARRDWAVVLITISGLNEFSDRYGFVSGNEVLRAAALVLGKALDEFGTGEDFLGDAGSGSFIAVSAPNKLDALQEQMASQLKRILTYFYPVADRESPALEAEPETKEDRKQLPPVISILSGAITDKDIKPGEVADIINALIKRQTTVAIVP